MDRIEQMAVLRAKGVGWSDIARNFSVESDTVRRYVSDRYGTTDPSKLAAIVHPDNEPVTIGVTAVEERDTKEIYKRLSESWNKRSALVERKREQVIRFPGDKPIALCGLADMHIGGEGVDYPRLEQEVDIIAQTPGMYAITLGDECDNFILNWCMGIRMGTATTIPDEWAAVEYILGKLGKKHMASVSGNHNEWSTLVSGMDIFGGIISQLNPTILYDRDDCRFRVEVGDNVRVQRIRHKWRGSSIYNPTHAIERAAQTHADFDDGWGAHTHVSGLVRQFNNRGKTGYAIQLGTYKRADDYSVRNGFVPPNEATACTLIMWPDGRTIASNDLIATADIMERYY